MNGGRPRSPLLRVILTSSEEDSDLKSAYDPGMGPDIEQAVSVNTFIDVAERPD